MSVVKVLDTGVLIGLCITIDQHHERCFSYLTDDECTVYITPVAHSEFQDIEKAIRTELHEELVEHRMSVSEEANDGLLDRDDLEWIRDNLIDRSYGTRSTHHLVEFYNQLMKDRFDIDKLELEFKIQDMEAEVWEDTCRNHSPDITTWRDIVEVWTKGTDTYRSIENELLICEGDDPKVCIQAHHVAVSTDGWTELATTNPKHFIKNYSEEPESRKDNILRVTDLDDVVDRSVKDN